MASVFDDLPQRAAICISQAYGIGACIYLRRLVENQINTLLDILLQTKQSEGDSEASIQKIRDTINEPMLENKIKLVTKADAQTGTNPVGLMYDQLSVAIHRLSDDEATQVAIDVSELFLDVVVRLKRRQKEEAEYLQRISALAKSRLPKHTT